MKHRLKKISLYTALALGVTFISVFVVGLVFRFTNQHEPLELGVSFSIKQTQNFRLDKRETLRVLTEEAGFKKLRLMSYWDVHERFRDVYNFNDLDWQFEQAQNTGASVTLAIGQRQPRWPECHIPHWAQPLEASEYQAELLDYLARVIERYKDHPALASYQLENEAANRSFGECPPLDRAFYNQEFDLVRQIDPHTALITNVSNQSGFQVRQPVGDRVGFTMYKTANFNAGNVNVQWNFWYVPSWWHGFRAAMIQTLHGSEAFVHEMQAEPWGPQDIWEMDNAYQLSSMPVSTIADHISDARRSGLNEIYIWGGEWFVWRNERFNDGSYLDFFSDFNRNLEHLPEQ